VDEQRERDKGWTTHLSGVVVTYIGVVINEMEKGGRRSGNRKETSRIESVARTFASVDI
jgi:hypothetical protein